MWTFQEIAWHMRITQGSNYYFELVFLVKWTFNYLATITWLIWPSSKENTQLRKANNWPRSSSTNILLIIIVHWGGCAESHWCWRTTRYGPFLYTNPQHSCSTVLKNCDFTLFLWFSVNLRTLPLEFSYYCSYKHNLMLQHFKVIIF